MGWSMGGKIFGIISAIADGDIVDWHFVARDLVVPLIFWLGLDLHRYRCQSSL